MVIEEDGEELEIYRRSTPFGSATEQGLQFVAFTAEAERPRKMLRRMFGVDDGTTDRLLGVLDAGQRVVLLRPVDPVAARRARRARGLARAGGAGSRKSTTAAVKASLRSPATMWPAPETSTNSTVGKRSRNAAAFVLADQVADPAPHEHHRDAAVDDGRRRRACSRSVSEISVGREVGGAAHERRVPVPVPAAVALPHVLRSPERSVGRGRCGL